MCRPPAGVAGGAGASPPCGLAELRWFLAFAAGAVRVLIGFHALTARRADPEPRPLGNPSS